MSGNWIFETEEPDQHHKDRQAIRERDKKITELIAENERLTAQLSHLSSQYITLTDLLCSACLAHKNRAQL